MKRIFAVILAALLSAAIFGCTSTEVSSSSNVSEASTVSVSEAESSAVSEESASSQTASAETDSEYFESEDLNTTGENVQQVTLNGSSIEFSGTGAAVSGTTLNITAAGTYKISGTLTDGQIFVEEDNKGVVHLILNGVNITSASSSAIYIKNSGKTIITLADGTENTLTDGAEYTGVVEEEPSACLFSKDDLTINGGGTLNVNGNYNDAITCKDDLKIVSGIYNITSKDDGIIGRDLLVVKDGSFTVNAQGDGLKATNDTTENSGVIALLGGEYNITAQADGIQAVTALNISGGNYTVVTGGGSANAPQKQGDFGFMGGTTAETDDSTSQKAIKATGNINITGGTFNVDSSDDSIHSNGTALISGGEFTLQSGDDGIHADTKLSIDGGNINVTKSYEGLESAELIINDGTISVIASDDGLNAAGGADSSNTNGGRGGDMFSTSTGTLTINGGTLYVNAGGDGLDANGNMYLTGGDVIVDGPEDGGNGALDYDGTFDITGGTLIAGGSTAMAQAPTESSTVYSIFVGTNQSSGAEIKLLDSSGNVVMSYTPQKTVQCVLFSSPDIKNGESYTVTANGETVGECTVSSSLTTIGNISVGMGGSMGGGGRGKMGTPPDGAAQGGAMPGGTMPDGTQPTM